MLRQIHEELDAAVAEAYGWRADLSDEEILARLVALNHERAEEERRGIVRWLRPEFQNPSGVQQTSLVAPVDGEETKLGKKKRDKALAEPVAPGTAVAPKGKAKKLAWPKSLSEQAAAVHGALLAIGGVASVDDVANRFLNSKKNRERIEELLDTLASLGKARELADGRFVAV